MTKVADEIIDTKKQNLVCKHKDCEKTATTRGFCRRHYQQDYRLRKAKGIVSKKIVEKRCIVPECLTIAVRWSLCRKHGQRLYYYRNTIKDFCRECPKELQQPVYCQHLCKSHFNNFYDSYTFELIPEEMEFVKREKPKKEKKKKKKRKRRKSKKRKKRKRQNKEEEEERSETKKAKRPEKKNTGGLKRIRGSRRRRSSRKAPKLKEILEENEEAKRLDILF